jgi:hypothetical protein
MIMTRAVAISIHAVSPLSIDGLLLAGWLGGRAAPRCGGASPAVGARSGQEDGRWRASSSSPGRTR